VGGALAPVGVYGESTGTGSSAAAFRINNASNTFSALFAETNGTGQTIFAQNIGTGIAADFYVTNPSNMSTGVNIVQSGTGIGLRSTNNNVNSNNPAIWAETNSNQPLSAPIYGLNTGTGDVAGSFRITNASSTQSSLYAETSGTGSAIKAISNGGNTIWSQNNGTAGSAGIFQNFNASNNAPSLFASTASNGPAFHADTDLGGNAVEGMIFGSGTGSAGSFEINNTASTAPAINAVTNGPGAAFSGDNTGAGDAVLVQKSGPAGSAGNFKITNASNPNDALTAITNNPAATAIGASVNDTGNQGHAFTIWNGGMRVSTRVLTGGGNIDERAVAYEIDGNSYVLNFTIQDGDIFYFFNSDIQTATVNSIGIPAGTGITLVNIGGNLRSF
jgi:hypothetical protein